MEKHPLHLKNPELQTSPEVGRAVERQEERTGEKIPNDPSARIEAYADRLENIFLNSDERVRMRNLELFRDKIYDTLIIKRENFPDSYFDLQKRIARERGEAVEEIPQNVREQMKDVAIQDQKASLDAWIEYLTEEDVAYPAWFKYFAWKNVTRLSQFDKERGKFKKRTDTAVARFPDVHRAALARILDIYEQVKADNKKAFAESEIKEAFFKKFPALYAELVSQSLAVSIENREDIRGEWIKYAKGNDAEAEKLFESMQGKGTGWCVEGKTTAHNYIDQGDFYVYYTHDKHGSPTQPRLAIQMSGNKIGQIRGILPHQEAEPIMQEVLDEKLNAFGHEADAYRKKSEDMKHLTALERKHENKELFTKDDLIFLYEINAPIQGFGYQKDPRVKELREGRNVEEDMLVLLECTKDQIARGVNEINGKTKVYLGPWNPTVFQAIRQYPTLQHLYESFLEGKIFMQTLKTDPSIYSYETAERVLTEKGMLVSDYAKDLLSKTEFSRNKETYKLVQFTVAQLGFPNGATTREILDEENLKKLGLSLCPAEVGLHLRAQYEGSDLKFIAMKPMTDRDGEPGVFDLLRSNAGLWLDGRYWAGPDDRWSAGRRFVFISRK